MTEGRVLVLGRMPPEGRDLDLLVRSDDVEALTRGLRDDDYVVRGDRWVRYRDCDVDVVDVTDVASWRLPPAEVDALFEAAVPVSGTPPLARPAPVHVVLIEARRWAAGSVLTDRRRARVDAALQSGPGVWDEVVRRAPAWGVEDALPVLRGESPAQETMRRVRRRAQRRPGRVITLSGVDGSGKSSQAQALVAALDRLGYPAVAVWTRITINPSLDVLAAPVKRVIALVSGRRRPASTAGSAADRAPGHGTAATDAARAFRLRHPTVNQAWLLVVAVVNAAAQWRVVAPHLARGRMVVCDRYTPDSAAHLRYKYGPEERYRLQTRVIRLLSPRPLRSYFLDVPGAVAHARKPEKYTAEHLERLAELYREECEWLGVRRLDGEKPRPELCATIADDVLAALLDRRQRRRRPRTSR